MIWFVVMNIFSMLLEWVRLRWIYAAEKDLKILLLRHQQYLLLWDYLVFEQYGIQYGIST